MNKTQKILTTSLWAVLVLTMVFIISAGVLMQRERARGESITPYGEAHVEPLGPLNVPVPAFTLVDQDSKPFTQKDMLGKVWIADFIFTHCGGPCPLMTSKLSQMQAKITNPNVHFVSFSVDPANDTPAVLKDYAKQFHADLNRWTFVTGDKTAVYAAINGMLMNVVPGTKDTPLEHDTKFELIDATGKIHSVYDSYDLAELAKLVTDAQSLASQVKAGQ
jgi:protein SCO1/2